MESPPREAWLVPTPVTGFHTLLTTVAALGPGAGAQGPLLLEWVCVVQRKTRRVTSATAGEMLEEQDQVSCRSIPTPVWGPHWTRCRIQDQRSSWEVTVSEKRALGLGPGAGGRSGRRGGSPVVQPPFSLRTLSCPNPWFPKVIGMLLLLLELSAVSD